MDRSLANLGLSRRASIWVPAALGLLGVAVTLFVWHAQVEQARGSLEDRFAAAAQDRADAVEQQLNASLAIVQMLGGVLDADNVIDETVFSGVSQSALDSGIAPIQALEWISAVSAEEREAFEAEVRLVHPTFSIQESDADGALRVATNRDIYYPVTFVTPLEGNEAALGFDLGSNAVRLQAVDQAADSGTLQLTERIRLVQETGEQFGFLALQPVYRQGATVETTAARRESLLGFTLGVYRAGDLVAGALSVFPAETVEVALLDPRAETGSQLLATVPHMGQTPISDGGALQASHSIDVAGSEWRVVATAMPAFGSAGWSWATLGGGLAITALMVALVRTVLLRTAQVRRMVAVRTGQLRAQRDQYQNIFDHAEVGIFTTTADNHFRTVNPSGLHMLGKPLGELTALTPLDLVAPDHRERMVEWRARRDAGLPVERELELPVTIGPSGERRWLSVHLHPMLTPSGSFRGMQGVFHDITAQIQLRDQLERDASTDSLTGLANRRTLEEFLGNQMASAKWSGASLSLLLIDLDRFKSTNDTYGHPAGDAVLRAVSSMLSEVSRDTDLVARIGGDEFVVVLPRTDVPDALDAAERCRARVDSAGITWEGQSLRASVSVGVATFVPTSHTAAGDLLAEADRALYTAKRAGRNTVRQGERAA